MASLHLFFLASYQFLSFFADNFQMQCRRLLWHGNNAKHKTAVETASSDVQFLIKVSPWQLKQHQWTRGTNQYPQYPGGRTSWRGSKIYDTQFKLGNCIACCWIFDKKLELRKELMMPSAERCSCFLRDKNYNEFAFYIKIVEIEIHLNIYGHFLVFLQFCLVFWNGKWKL